MVRVIVEHLLKSREDAEKLVAIIHQIRAEAMKQPGYVTGEALVDSEDPCNVLVISTWNREEQWRAWDNSDLRISKTKPMLPLLREPYQVRIFNFATFRAGRVLSIF
jgi:heme-degrading monooxygenase HmoA